MTNQRWYRVYIFIWIGQFLSMLSSYSVHFAIIIWLSLQYQSAKILAIAGIAALLPQALIGPFAGVFIDRWNRKKLMIYADAFIAICAIAMALVLLFDQENLFWIFMLLGLRSVGNAFHAPAMQAIAPLIVPEQHLLRVSGVNQMIQSVSTITGPAVGALAITYLSIGNVLYLDVIGAAAAIVSLLFVTIPHLKKEKSNATLGSVLSELKQGFHAISSNRGLSFLFLYSMIATLVIMPIAVMFPLLTTGYYGGDKWEMSIIEIVWGIGMLLGGSLLSAKDIKLRKVILVNAMHLALGICFIASGWLPAQLFIGFVLMTAVGGMAMSVFSAAFMTIIQEEVDPSMLGRVFSLYFSMAVLPSLIGLLFTGIIAESIGINNAFVISGILVVLVGFASFLTPSLMQLGKKTN